MKQYGSNRLAEHEANLPLRRRHADYFLAFVEIATTKLAGPEQMLWLDRLESEHDNLRAALDYCRAEAGRAQTGLRLASALPQFWETRGYLREGRFYLESLLARSDIQEPSKDSADALNGAGSLARLQGDYEVARSYHSQSLAMRRELGDTNGIAISLGNLGIVAEQRGDYASARAYQDESLRMCQEVGDKHGMARAHFSLGIVLYWLGDYDRARSSAREPAPESGTGDPLWDREIPGRACYSG